MDPPALPSSRPRRRGPKPSPYSSSSNGQLHLSSLPRFHPANFNSASSSMTTTPNSAASPNPPYFSNSVDQSQLSYYHQHLLAQSALATTATGSNGKRPNSPKLAPLAGSPGPVTPLELDGENYLTAGLSSHSQKNVLGVDAMLREEARRRGELSPRTKNWTSRQSDIVHVAWKLDFMHNHHLFTSLDTRLSPSRMFAFCFLVAYFCWTCAYTHCRFYISGFYICSGEIRSY